MADFVSHYIMGAQASDLFHKIPRAVVRSCPEAFRWGLQGPDLMFFRKAIGGGSPLPGYGSRVHTEKTEELFHEFALTVSRLSGPMRETACAYFYGLICHYSLDSFLHPYVYFHQQKLAEKYPDKAASALHFQVETDIDMALYRRIFHRPIRDFDPRRVYAIPVVQRTVIAYLWHEVLLSVYDIDCPEAELLACFEDALSVNSLLYRGTWFLYPLSKIYESATGRKGLLSTHIKFREPKWDCLNRSCSRWYNPDEPEHPRSDSVPELLLDSLLAANELCLRYALMFDNGTIESVPFKTNFQPGAPKK